MDRLAILFCRSFCAARFSPSNITSPAVGVSSMLIHRTKVLFPAPDRPIMPKTSPRAISRLISSRATTGPLAVLNSFPTFRNRIIGSPDSIAIPLFCPYMVFLHNQKDSCRARPRLHGILPFLSGIHCPNGFCGPPVLRPIFPLPWGSYPQRPGKRPRYGFSPTGQAFPIEQKIASPTGLRSNIYYSARPSSIFQLILLTIHAVISDYLSTRTCGTCTSSCRSS